jgi:hypothetical protein
MDYIPWVLALVFSVIVYRLWWPHFPAKPSQPKTTNSTSSSWDDDDDDSLYSGGDHYDGSGNYVSGH